MRTHDRSARAVRPLLSIVAMAALAMAALALGTPPVLGHDGTDGVHLDGTWERLPAPPSPTGLDATDAVVLADGDIAVLATARSSTNSGACVSVFSTADESWTDHETAGEGIDEGRCFMDDEQFVLAPDGRLYSSATAIDPTAEPWRVEPGTLWELADSDGELPIAIADDLVYVLQMGSDADGSVIRLVEVDVMTDETRTTAALAKWNWWVVAGPAESVYAMHLSGVIARYDTGADAWHDEAPRPPAPIDRTSAAIGPDGRIYALGDEVAPFPELWAWDPGLEQWLRVPIPDDLNGEWWKPQLVAGADGALYAMDMRQAYRFLPGEVDDGADVEGAPPGGGGYGGVTGPSPAPTAAATPRSSVSPTPTATPSPSPTPSSEAPIPSSESPSSEPSASPSIHPVPAAAAVDGPGPVLVLLLVLAVLAAGAVIGVMAWQYRKVRRARRAPAASTAIGASLTGPRPPGAGDEPS